MLRFLFARYCRSHRWLRKWWTVGIAIPRCQRHPRRLIMLSSSFVVEHPFSNMSLIIFIYATNLLFGNDTNSWCVSICHPRVIFSSSISASAISLLHASISSLGYGSCGSFGRAQQSIASSIARLPLDMLSDPSTWIVALFLVG